MSDDRQLSVFNAIINRMGATLAQLFHSNASICSSCQSLTTRPITRPVNMIIARSIAPLPSFNLPIPFYLFLPSNLRGVVNYLSIKMANNSQQNDFYKWLRKNIARANGFICNSMKEFDEKYIDEFYRLFDNHVPIHFIGPLIFNDQKSSDNKVRFLSNLQKMHNFI